MNADWLSKYRSWVYGVGFGWQIGVGVTTYVMTAAVPLMIVVGALSANPWAALAIGVIFGLARGLAVLIGARVRTVPALYAFHRRFGTWAAPVRRAVIGVEACRGRHNGVDGRADARRGRCQHRGGRAPRAVEPGLAARVVTSPLARGPGRDRTFDRGIMRGPSGARGSRTEAVFTLLSKGFRTEQRSPPSAVFRRYSWSP